MFRPVPAHSKAVLAALVAVYVASGALFAWLWAEPAPIGVQSRRSLPFEFLSSKTPYTSSTLSMYHSNALDSDRCELAHVQYISRHGSRHTNKLKNEKAVIQWLRDQGTFTLSAVLCLHSLFHAINLAGVMVYVERALNFAIE